MVNDLQGSTVMDGLPKSDEAADPHGSWLLALADGAAADYLVTGDKRAGLLPRQRIGNARIVTAATFCHDVLREPGGRAAPATPRP